MRNLFFALATFSIISCNFHDQRKNDAVKALKKADSVSVYNQHDSALMKKAHLAVQSFVSRFPEDSLSPVFLFQLARIYQNQGQYDISLKYFDSVYSNYPLSKEASKAVFYQGFIYSDKLRLYDLARAKYQLYLDNYSSVDAKLTSDAKFELAHMGKSPEEILQEITNKPVNDSTQTSSSKK